MNLRKRIAKLEQNLGAETITLRFADGRTETIKCIEDYEETLLRLLVGKYRRQSATTGYPVAGKAFQMAL